MTNNYCLREIVLVWEASRYPISILILKELLYDLFLFLIYLYCGFGEKILITSQCILIQTASPNEYLRIAIFWLLGEKPLEGLVLRKLLNVRYVFYYRTT